MDVLFDLDGTLVDSLPGIEASLRLAAEKVLPGSTVPPLRPFIGPPLPAMLGAVFPGVSGSVLDEVAREFRGYYLSVGCFESRVFSGTIGGLRALRARGCRLHIATNKPSEPTAKILGFLGLSAFFETVACRDSISPDFPSKTETLSWLLKARALDSSRSIFVGDSRDDFEAARHNGMLFVAAAYGYGGAASDLSAEKFADIPRIVFQISGGPYDPA